MGIDHIKHQFNFPEDVVYLNNASFSPALKSVERAGMDAIKRKTRPDLYDAADLFEPVIELRALFAQLIDVENLDRVVTIPSVSYGMATIANNISLNNGDEIILIEEQFPSNVYIWQELAKTHNARIKTIKQPQNSEDWNNSILQEISDKTALVALGHIHWANGFIFDIEAIRKKTRQHSALFIIDGSQSIGALPFSVKSIQPDALICAGYKWLFGPYGCAYAYYGEFFDSGKPIEQNWINRLGSENLKALTNYQSKYKPFAQRYAAGESASFIYVKMQIAALKELLKFNVEDLQTYCHDISKAAVTRLKANGFAVDNDSLRAKHLFGIKIPKSIDLELLKRKLKEANIHVSFRGEYIRVSCHYYNNKNQFDKLAQILIDHAK